MYIGEPESDIRWEEAAMSTITPHHDLRTLEMDKPFAEQFGGIDAIVQLGAQPFPDGLLEAARGVKLWQLQSVGYDKVDVEGAKALGVPLCNCPGSTSAAGLAQSAIMFMLLLATRYHEAQDELAAGRAHNPMGTELEGLLLGFIGFGASARATADLAKAFGMRFAIVEPMDLDQEALDTFQPEFVVKPHEMHRVFEESDVVSLHCPLVPETRGCINADLIGRMKPTAIFINTARGDLVDQEALYSALLENRIAGIGTDVHAGVYPDHSHAVYKHPNFYAMPHVSGTTAGSAVRRAQVSLQNLNRVAAGEAPLHLI
jgi:phosphoglycerate dehydrogenase-like enzyme